MAFQSQISADVSESNISSVSDISNYNSNGVNGHELNKFTKFFIITITRPIDGEKFYFVTEDIFVDGNQQEVSPPSVAVITDVEIPYWFTSVNGEYTMRITAVPTWDAATNYQSGTIVYHAATGLLWANLSDVPAGDTPGVSGNWEDLTLEVLESGNYENYSYVDSFLIDGIVNNSETFAASLFINNTGDVSINSDATAFIIGDHSNTGNDEQGHAASDFQDYIKLAITNPLGAQVVYQDEIEPLASGVTQYTHLLGIELIDGIYNIEIWHYPTWNANAYYNSAAYGFPVIVFWNDKLWKTITPTMDEPSSTSTVWSLYDGDGKETRYYDIARFVTVDFQIKPYHDKLARKNSSKIHNNPCGVDLCSDKCMRTLVTTGILLHLVEIDTCEGRFDAVKKHIDALNTLKCNGCC